MQNVTLIDSIYVFVHACTNLTNACLAVVHQGPGTFFVLALAD